MSTYRIYWKMYWRFLTACKHRDSIDVEFKSNLKPTAPFVVTEEYDV